MQNPWNVCDTMRDEYNGCWGKAIVLCLGAVYRMFDCELILEVMVVLILPPLELMEFLRPALDMVQDGVQELVILELVSMSMYYEGK